jgi:hypothetical protein
MSSPINRSCQVHVEDRLVLGSVLENSTESATAAPVESQSNRGAPLVEASDLFDRFWNASRRAVDRDWTTIGAACDCGDCYSCGLRYALGWTSALLSNPTLADHAERLQEKRAG